MSKKVAYCAMLLALALVFSYLESLIPIPFRLPGMKLGIANLVVVSGLYFLKPGEVFLISMMRILLMGFLFGNGMSLIYSLAGGIVSFFAMVLVKRCGGFSVVGVSIAGGVFHNVGQVIAAAALISSFSIMVYLPALLIAGAVTGALLGMVSRAILPLLKRLPGESL